MAGPWTITSAPLAGLALTVLAQIVVVHASRGKVGASIIIGIFCGLAVTLAAIALGRAETPGATGGFADTWLLGVTTYLALAFGFWAFLNLNITSMRIRMLRQLLRAGGHMALSDMAVSYTPAERLRRRLERLKRAANSHVKTAAGGSAPGRFWRSHVASKLGEISSCPAATVDDRSVCGQRRYRLPFGVFIGAAPSLRE